MSDQLIEEQEKRDREFDDSGYEEKPIFHFGEIGKLADKLKVLVDSNPMDFLGKDEKHL